MGAQEYGALCKRHAEELGISQSRLASRLMRAFALEEDEERTYDATTVRLIYDGRRKIDDKLFEKLNQLLGIPQDEAEYTLGIWPSGFDLAEYRRVRHLAASTPSELTARRVGQTVLPVPAELQDAALARRLGVANLERRRVQRRRRLRLVPQVERRVA